MTTTVLQRALTRLLFDSVADQAECTCAPGDRCPQCEAMAALGLGRWGSWKRARRLIGARGRELKRAAGPS